MPDVYTSEHEDFRKTARTFYEREVVPFHDQWEKDGIVPRELWLKAGEAGLLCFDVPEEYDGPGVDDFRYNVIVSEEQTRAGASGPGFSVHTDIIVPYITSIGTDEQKQRWLPGCVSGEIITAIAMTEPGAGSDLQGRSHHRRRQGRPLPRQRLQDVHQQRHQRRPGHRGRAHRPRGRPQGHQPAGPRARHGGLRARPQPGQDRAARPGHRRALLHRRRRAQGEPPRRGG